MLAVLVSGKMLELVPEDGVQKWRGWLRTDG
jgi:hypothetical protein